MKNREAGFSGFETTITLLVIAIIAVVGFSVYSRQTHKLPIISDNTPKVRTVSKPKVSQIGSDKDLGNGFQTYTNTQLGFALDIPKNINDGHGAPCTYELNKNTGYYSYRPAGGLEPAIVVEDGQQFAVAPKVTYQLGDVMNHKSYGDFGSCTQTYTTAKVIRDSLSKSTTKPSMSALRFVVTNASSLSAFATWAKTYFQDPTITAVDGGKSTKGDWEKINLDCTSSDPCSEFNFKFDLRYYEKQKKLVYFEFGQSGNLQKPTADGSTQFYDNQVVDSFHLLAN